MKKRAQLQMSFAWIFAIIVGAAILFLGIFIATKLIKTGDTATTAKTGKEIGALLNPLETGAEEGTVVTLDMPVETRINNYCDNRGVFGKQIISISQKSFNKWSETDLNQSFTNKYIFSKKITEGKSFIIFAKPFEMPFKVSDVIYLTSKDEKYCFSDSTPNRVKDELKDLQQENIVVAEDEICPQGSIEVCFSSEDCDINVNEFQKSVTKINEDGDKEQVYYEGDSLMYAAIFSDKATYECHVKRLMQRLQELTNLYQEKQTIVEKQGCFDTVNLDLLEFSANAYVDSKDLISVQTTATTVEVQNNIAECKLW